MKKIRASVSPLASRIGIRPAVAVYLISAPPTWIRWWVTAGSSSVAVLGFSFSFSFSLGFSLSVAAVGFSPGFWASLP